MSKYLLIALLASIAVPCRAQSGGVLAARFHSGFSVPQSPREFSAPYGVGPNFGLSFGYALPAGVEFALSGTYSAFGIDAEGLAESHGLEGEAELTPAPGHAYMWGASALARVYAPGTVWAPYILGGIGMRRFGRGRMTAEVNGEIHFIPGEEDTGAAVMGGFGLLVGISDNLGLYSEAAYERMISGEIKRAAIPVKIGLIFQIGAMY